MPPPAQPHATAGAAREEVGERGSRGTAALSSSTLGRARTWAARASLLLPGAAIVLRDVSLRPAHLAALSAQERLSYAATAVLGAVAWGALVAVAAQRSHASRWVARVLLATGALLAVGGQLYAFTHYQAYLNVRAVLVGTSMMPSLGQQLWFDRVSFARALLPPLVLAGAFVALTARLARSSRPRRPAWLALDLATVSLVVMLFAPPRHGEQDATFDVLYVNGMGQLLRARWDHNECVERLHPGPRTPRAVPALAPRPSAPRNVLLVLTESVRAMSTCVAFDDACIYTPFTNKAARGRIPFRQMRAVDSTTAISLAVLWSGLSPVESRADLHSAPLIWEYANAAGMDTAYWTSQNLLFGNAGVWLEGLPIAHAINATELDEDASLETGADDAKLVSYVEGALGELREPFLGVVHLSNTHFPYVVDPELLPFTPQSEAFGAGDQLEVTNRYQDSIYLQDRAVGRLIDAVRARPEGARTVIVFVSDHGEQVREKGAVGHTGTLFDPEIRIPFWIDAPPGTLTAREEETLRSLSNSPVTSLDVMPTLLDLLGVWDAKDVAPFRARMAGESLLRGGSPSDRAIVLTNCSELWACAFKNWGAMQGTKKLVGTQNDRAWSCFDVAADPKEEDDLGAEACGGLVALAEDKLHGRPW